MVQKIRKKPLAEQVIVITGASSGIGLSTARLALERGACVVMADRSFELPAIAERLRTKRNGMRQGGFSEGLPIRAGDVEAIVADVGREEDVRRIAARAIERFGRIDTWINNAGETIYGRTLEVPVEEMKALFDTDVWGVVYGSRVAVENMRAAGGTLINVGSVLSDRAVPLQGAYSAAKQAVKAFTDALRVELMHDGIPVTVTLIKPATIDTPFFAHAKNRMADGIPASMSPAYAPEAVAEAMLRCAVMPVREVAVGLGGRAQFTLARLAPRLADRVLAGRVFDMQKRDQPHDARTLGAGEERGDHQGRVMQTSAYSALRTSPMAAAPVAVGIVAGLGAIALAIGLTRIATR